MVDALRISFYNITIGLNYKDTLKFCNSNKANRELCNESYWKLKAKINYDYDLNYIDGSNTMMKYAILEQYMLDNNTSHSIPAINNKSYYWTKRFHFYYPLTRDFTIRPPYTKQKFDTIDSWYHIYQ